MLRICALVALMTCGAARCAPLVITRSDDLGRPFVAAGTRAFAVGTEGGDFEVWTYPLKLFRTVHVVVRPATGDPISLNKACTSVAVRPESVTSVHELSGGKVTMTVFVPADKAGVVVILSADGLADGAVAQVELASSLRLLWPGVSDGISPVLACDGTEVAVLFNAMENGPAVFGAVKASAPIRRLVQRNAPDGVSATFPESGSLVFAFAGSVGSADEAITTAAELVRNFGFYLRNAAEYYGVASAQCDLRSSLASLDTAFGWAKVSLAACATELRTVGAGLIAGYGSSGTGNRPGRAWWDGRDSLWGAAAAAAVGQVKPAVATLECLGRNQGRDGESRGQVPSVVSPVGRLAAEPVRYEGPEATSLFLTGLRWLWRWTGDDGLVRRQKDAAVKALDWLKARDPGDALSLAAVQAARELTPLLGLQERADELRDWETRARASALPDAPAGLLPARWTTGGDNAEPLEIAWESTTAFRAGDAERGLTLLESIVRLAGAGALGRMPQSAAPQGAGATGAVLSAPSEAAVVLPVICGMLGLEPDAPHDSLTVRPSLPASVPEVRLTGLRLGTHEVDLVITRGRDLVVTHRGKRALTVSLQAEGRENRADVGESATLTWP